MIGQSTTLTEQGREIRRRLVWAVGAVVAVVVLAFAFVLLDRSSVVGGPTGSSFVTTATGLAAFHDTLARDGRSPARIQVPLSPQALADLDGYLVADVDFGRFEETELRSITGFVAAGGTAVILGIPPQAITEAFAVELEWAGSPVGEVPVTPPSAHATTVEGSRFGSFAPGHGGEVLAGDGDRDLVVAFAREAGRVVFVADSSVGHNATVDRADNIDFLGNLLPGRTGFDEHRHGYSEVPPGGMLDAAPGNWRGAAMIGAFALGVGLIAYGRRFGPIEPTERVLVPDRATYIDSVARALRRAEGGLPTAPLRTALVRALGLPADADRPRIMSAGLRAGLTEETIGAIDREGVEQGPALDRALAELTTRRGTAR